MNKLWLTPYERWAVKANLERIATGEYTADELVELLEARGYGRIAQGVKDAIKENAEKLVKLPGGPRCTDGITLT